VKVPAMGKRSIETVRLRILLRLPVKHGSTCGAATRYHQAESTPEG
jgi:hypothetical protein